MATYHKILIKTQKLELPEFQTSYEDIIQKVANLPKEEFQKEEYDSIIKETEKLKDLKNFNLENAPIHGDCQKHNFIFNNSGCFIFP